MDSFSPIQNILSREFIADDLLFFKWVVVITIFKLFAHVFRVASYLFIFATFYSFRESLDVAIVMK